MSFPSLCRPIKYAPNEIRGFTERANYMISIAPTALADTILPPKEGFHRFIRKDPLGVVLIIAAWNYPYLISVNGVIPAILAGKVTICMTYDLLWYT